MVILCSEILLVFKLASRQECRSKPLEVRRRWLTPLTPVFRSFMPLIPALERWRETGRDMAGQKEEYKAKGDKSSDIV